MKGVGLAVGDHARRLHDSVALSEVSPPHVLVGDLYDVSYGEPALLTVGQADAFVTAWEKEEERRKGWGGRRTNKGRFGGFCIVHARKSKQINKLLRWRVED